MPRHTSVSTFVGGLLLTLLPFDPAHSQTHWIWQGSRAEGEQMTLRTTFSLDSLPQAATLRAGTDFCDAVIYLNGQRVARQGPYDAVLPIDVRRYCVQGENVVAIHAVSYGGPAALALELDAQLGDNATVRIRSGQDWDGDEASDVRTFGRVDVEAWWNVTTAPSTSAFDEYNQWQETRELEPNAVDHLQIQDDFEIEVVQHAESEDESWISMTVDDRGRLIFGREKAGIVRLTLREGESNQIEEINSTVAGNHGVLWTTDGLYVSASNSQALFRIRDSDGDDTFDEVQQLKHVPGGKGDHGRNDLVAGPNGQIYMIFGDSVDVPEGFTSRVPATTEFGESRRPRGGHVARTDRDGGTWEIVASGLRNPYGIDFNHDDEMFTYDADSERHVGLPWYRPTRMYHLVPGVDYGWRSRNALPWPMYLPDFLPPNALIGRGSPTSLKFAGTNDFSPAYRGALFALEWAYGRVFAVHVVPRGASYSMHPLTFMRGRPFNVVDLDFAPDGSMYLLTGGRGTRSTVYRVRYSGPTMPAPEPTQQQQAREDYAKSMRALRRELESFQQPDPEAVAKCWVYLDHSDLWIRHLARIAIEHQPTEAWSDRIWTEPSPDVALSAMLALVRRDPSSHADRIWTKLSSLALTDLLPEQQLVAVRVAQLMPKDTVVATQLLEQFEPIYPGETREVNRELSSLLAEHGSTTVVRHTLDLLAAEQNDVDALHYLMVLASAKYGWNSASRDEYFRLLRGARLFLGDEQMPRVLAQLEQDALANVPDADRNHLAALLTTMAADDTKSEPTVERPFVRQWTVAEVVPRLTSTKPDAQRGRKIFHQAQCSKCHRLGTMGRAFGPDLTGVSARFNRREVLDAILVPSKVISSRFTNHVIATDDGQVITGQVVWNGFRKGTLRIATDPTRMDQFTEISKRSIVSHEPSPVSPMPSGLLDTFAVDEIADLLAFLSTN